MQINVCDKVKIKWIKVDKFLLVRNWIDLIKKKCWWKSEKVQWRKLLGEIEFSWVNFNSFLHLG